MTLAEGILQNEVMALKGAEDEIRKIIEFGTWRYVHKKDLTEKSVNAWLLYVLKKKKKKFRLGPASSRCNSSGSQ
jgi:hypothetical protein